MMKAKQPEGTEAALQRSAHLALILGLSLIGVAAAYFAAIYLIAR